VESRGQFSGAVAGVENRFAEVLSSRPVQAKSELIGILEGYECLIVELKQSSLNFVISYQCEPRNLRTVAAHNSAHGNVDRKCQRPRHEHQLAIGKTHYSLLL
jgi:hypothetical protein